MLMFGMNTMSGAVKPLQRFWEFTNILLKFSKPDSRSVGRALLTAAVIPGHPLLPFGILQALCVTGAVRYGAALPIIMGQNIGTCITAMLFFCRCNQKRKRIAASFIWPLIL